MPDGKDDGIVEDDLLDAPQELARILGEAIDHARQGQLAAERAMRKK